MSTLMLRVESYRTSPFAQNIPQVRFGRNGKNQPPGTKELCWGNWKDPKSGREVTVKNAN